MPAISVPAAKRELVDQLTAALPGVHVQWGLPRELATDRERIYVAGAEDYRRGDQHEERYLLRLVIEVEDAGADSAEAASSRAWELVEQIDVLLLQDQELDGLVWTAEIDDVRDDLFATDEGWIARALARIRITNRDATFA